MKRYHVSKNLFDKTSVKANTAISDSSGNEFGASGLNASDYINVNGMSKIALLNTLSSRWGAFYDSSKIFVSGFNGYGIKNVPQNAVYVRVTIPDAYLNIFMMNEGDELLPYEPYGSEWQTKSPPNYGTGTDAVTTLPVTLYTDGQPIAANLLDFNTWYSQLSPTRCTLEKTDNSIKISATSDDAHTGNGGYHIPVSANTSYTFSYKSSNSNSGVGYIFENGIADSEHWHTFNNNNKQPITFTTRSDTTYIILRLGVSATGNYITYFDMMLNTGSTALPYQPYAPWVMKGNTETSGTPSPSNPITIEGVGNRTANLFDYQTMDVGLQNTYLDSSGNELSSNDWDTTTYIPCDGMSFTLYPVGGNTPAICLYDDNKQFIVGKMYNTGGADRKRVVTITSETTAKYIRFSYYKTSTPAGAKDDLTQIFLINGTYTIDTIPPYEPYGYKIPISANSTALTPVYLTEQLMKISDYADNVSSSGTVTRNVIKQVFTGQENWDIYSAGTDVSFFYLVLGSAITGRNSLIICTHFERKAVDTVSNIVGIDLVSSGTIIRLRPPNVATDYSSTTAWKQWLADQYAAGTPVTVYYVLATATTESVTAPSIPTTGGEVTIDVDTIVKPSELDLTYHGWHSHEPLKRENGSWN